jgi:hypothetical protein
MAGRKRSFEMDVTKKKESICAGQGSRQVPSLINFYADHAKWCCGSVLEVI